MKRLLIILFILFPLTSFGQASYQPLVGNIPGLIESSSSSNLGAWINNVYMFMVGLAGALAIVMLFYAGFQFVISGDSASKRDDAKKRIVAALGGLLLAVASYVILNTINPQLVSFDLDFKGTKAPEVNVSASAGGSSSTDPNSAGGGGLSGSSSVAGGYSSDPSGSFFGSVGVDSGFVRHDDYSNPMWNYYHGTGTISSSNQINTGLGIPGATIVGAAPGSTSGNITLSHFGGPGDVRITSDKYALQYCNNRYGGSVGSYVESTNVGNTEYRWCYALDSNGNKISFPQGSRSAHGGYFETTAVSLERFSAMNPQTYYVAYPLNDRQLSDLPNPRGVSNSKLRSYQMVITAKNGQTFTGYIADRGPHGSLNKIDVSPGMYNDIMRAGGAASARLIENSTGNTITRF